MATTFTNVFVHIIFHTKSASVKINEKDLPEIFRYIGGVIHSMSGVAHMVGGRPDHVHILSTLPISLSLGDFIRSIKSNSSRWIKSLDAEYHGFAWQRGYGAFSVSTSQVRTVVDYIRNQKEHHRIHSADEELLLFLKKNGLENMVTNE